MAYGTTSPFLGRQVLLGMVLAVCIPVLYLLIPDLFYGNPNWYDLWQAYFIMFSSCLEDHFYNHLRAEVALRVFSGVTC